MASVDLSDAFYSAPILESQKMFLRFLWKGALAEFQVLLNGLSPGLRIFTKLLKPIFSKRAEKGHVYFPYSFILASTEQKYLKGANDLLQLFSDFGT